MLIQWNYNTIAQLNGYYGLGYIYNYNIHNVTNTITVPWHLLFNSVYNGPWQ